jgi:hypothetical protein
VVGEGLNVAWTELKALAASTWSWTGFSSGAEPGTGSMTSQCRAHRHAGRAEVAEALLSERLTAEL